VHQGNIDEAKNHVAIVRSSEFASAKALFDELFARQEAVLAKLSPGCYVPKLAAKSEQVG
jgi:ESCRT-I complex subunit VPS37